MLYIKHYSKTCPGGKKAEWMICPCMSALETNTGRTIMNGKFFELPLEKQERIIKAAYMVFAHDNYKNASMSRIADDGGISKSLLFHYFQNKKDLYLYLWENINRISNEIELKYYYKETSDFFEAMTQKVLARCEFMRTAPDEYLFSLQALFAENPEIRGGNREVV